jgi:hypothetical protein
MIVILSQEQPFAENSNLAVNNPFNPAKGAVGLDDLSLESISANQISLTDLDENDMRPAEELAKENSYFFNDFLHECASGNLCDEEFNRDKIYAPQEVQGDVIVGMEIIVIQGNSSVEISDGDATTLSQGDPLENNSTVDENRSAYFFDMNIKEHQNYIPQELPANLIFYGHFGNPNFIATAAELAHFFEDDTI